MLYIAVWIPSGNKSLIVGNIFCTPSLWWKMTNLRLSVMSFFIVQHGKWQKWVHKIVETAVLVLPAFLYNEVPRYFLCSCHHYVWPPHLKSQRMTVLSFVFPSRSLEARMKSLPKDCSSVLGCIINSFSLERHLRLPTRNRTFPIQRRRVFLFVFFQLVASVLNLTIFHQHVTF